MSNTRLRSALALFAAVLTLVAGMTVMAVVSASRAIETADASASAEILGAGGNDGHRHRQR